MCLVDQATPLWIWAMLTIRQPAFLPRGSSGSFLHPCHSLLQPTRSAQLVEHERHALAAMCKELVGVNYFGAEGQFFEKEKQAMLVAFNFTLVGDPFKHIMHMFSVSLVRI